MKKLIFTRKKILLLLIAALILSWCTACVPTQYSSTDQHKILEAAQALMEEKLSEYGYSIKPANYEVCTGNLAGQPYLYGSYLSHVVKAEANVDGTTYHFAVNTETEELFTDYQMPSLNNIIEEQIKEYMTRYGYNIPYLINFSHCGYYVKSTDIPKAWSTETVESETYIENLFPIKVVQEYIKTKDITIIKNIPLTRFNLYYETDGEFCMDLHCLTDYLEETGNYLKDYTADTSQINFMLYGCDANTLSELETNANLTTEGRVCAGYTIHYAITDKVLEGRFQLSRRTSESLEGINIFYTSLTANGSLSDISAVYSFLKNNESLDSSDLQMEEYPLELSINNNILDFKYHEQPVYIYWKEKPDYTKITRTTGTADASTALSILQLKEHIYTLTDNSQYYDSMYALDMDQTITFSR